MGIEPTFPIFIRNTGFEVQETHQRPFHFLYYTLLTNLQGRVNNNLLSLDGLWVEAYNFFG